MHAAVAFAGELMSHYDERANQDKAPTTPESAR